VFFGIGVPELIILSVLGVVPIGIGTTAVMIKRRATRLGYASASSYLRAAPRSDLEKRDAADLALKGAVFCLLGMVFAPFVLVGLVPLFYGGRKLVWASMGLGLVDDGDQPGA
jgi:hypothetical protein